VLDLGLQLSVLLGAILVVTGPTVVIPLLRHIRPVRRVASVARCEGIVIDPVGATPWPSSSTKASSSKAGRTPPAMPCLDYSRPSP